MRGKCFMKLSLPFFVFFSCKMPWNKSTWSSTWSPPAGKSHHNRPLLLASTSGMLPGIKPPTQPTPQTSQVSAHPRAYPASHHRPGDQNVKRSPPGDPLLVAENTKISCVMFFFFLSWKIIQYSGTGYQCSDLFSLWEKGQYSVQRITKLWITNSNQVNMIKFAVACIE